MPSPAGAAVCIPLFGAHDVFVRCLKSVLAHTPTDVPIVVADDRGPDPASEAWVRELDESGVLEHDVHWLRQPKNLGFVANANRGMAACGRADVALINSDIEVADGWLDGLRDAAYSDTLIATATALTNDGTLVSVPYRNVPQASLPQDLTFDDAARRVRETAALLRPDLPTAIGHCIYIRRDALDLVGAFDESFSPGYGEEVDFSQRCVQMGLRHVAADDVLVLHHGRSSLGVDGHRNPRQDKHEKILRSRHPHYALRVREAEHDQSGPLARSLAIAARALLGPRVTIDGRCLNRSMTGTQVHTLELLSALWRTKRVQLRVVVPPDLGDTARDALLRMPDVDVVSADEAAEGIALDDIVHRPYQVSSPKDMRLLPQLGRRVVVTHQDLIAYRNPTYASGVRDWSRLRKLTREALALADLVLFFSEHAARDAAAEDLVTPDRSRVVHIGVDHHFESHVEEPVAPAGAEGLDDRPFLLVLGTDFRHKNRPFALRVFERLRADHQWPGRLVLAGPSVTNGSSAGDEAGWLALRPGLARDVVKLPMLDERGKDWLVDRCAAVLYPTTYEGFGLLPFEAAQAGKPCLFAHVTSLTELLGDVEPAIVPWDAGASADRIAAILNEPDRAARLVSEVRAVGERLTWDRTAAELLEAYTQTLRLASPSARAVVGESLVRDARYWGLRETIGPTGMSLVDPDEPLLDVPAQRMVAALSRRKMTRGPFLRTLRAVQRATARSAEAEGLPTGSHTDDEYTED